LIGNVSNIICVISFVNRQEKDIYNANAVIFNSEIKGIYHKMLVPNYRVFDEQRYFEPGNNPLIFKFNRSISSVEWRRSGTIQ
jgi:NAD+ synthase (glutamine-hydrolysing)